MNDLQTQLFNTLYSEYGTMLLSKKQTARIIGVSEPQMNKDKAAGVGVAFQQNGLSNVKYPLHEVVKYLTENTIKTA